MEPDNYGLEELDNVANCTKLINDELTIKQETYKCQIRIQEALRAHKKKRDDSTREKQAHIEWVRALHDSQTASDRSMEYTFIELKRTTEELLRSKAEIEEKKRADAAKWQEMEARFTGSVWTEFTGEYESSSLIQKVVALEAQVKQEELRQRVERAEAHRLREALRARADMERQRDLALHVTFARAMTERAARVRQVAAARARLAALERELRAHERARERARSASVAAVKSLNMDWERIEQRESSVPKVARYRAPPPPRRDNVSSPYTNPNNFLEKDFTISAVVKKPCGTKLKYGFWCDMPTKKNPSLGIGDVSKESGTDEVTVHKRVMENMPVPPAPAHDNSGKDDIAMDLALTHKINEMDDVAMKTAPTHKKMAMNDVAMPMAPTHKEKMMDDTAIDSDTEDVGVKVAPAYKRVMDDVATNSDQAREAEVTDDVALKTPPARKIRVLDDVVVNEAAAKAIVQAAQIDKLKFVDVIMTRPDMQRDCGEGPLAAPPSYPTSGSPSAIGDLGLLVPPTQFQDAQEGKFSTEKMQNKSSYLPKDGGVQDCAETTSTAAEEAAVEAAADTYRDLMAKLSCSPTFTYSKKNTEVTSKFFNSDANIALSNVEASSPPPAASAAAPLPPPLCDITRQGEVPPAPPVKRYGCMETELCEYGPALSLNLTDGSELDDTYDFSHMLGTPSLLLSPKADDSAPPAAVEPPASIFGLHRPAFSMFGLAAAPAAPAPAAPAPAPAAPPAGEPSASASAAGSEPGFNFNFQAKKKGGFFSLFN